MLFSELSAELQEKVRACTSIEELEELCKAEDLDLADGMLEGISSGAVAGNCTPWCMSDFPSRPHNLL